MKKLIVLSLTFAAFLSAADYSGIWNGKGGVQSARYGVVPRTAQMTLLQAGNSVSGTLKFGNGGLLSIKNGTVSGNQVTFSIDMGGRTGVLTYNGTVLQGRITSSTGEIVDIVFSKQ